MGDKESIERNRARNWSEEVMKVERECGAERQNKVAKWRDQVD